jgi:hypothetical protein
MIWSLLAGAPRLGRPGVLLCVAAVLVFFGRLGPRAALLLILCCPIPSFIQEALGSAVLARLQSLLAFLFGPVVPDAWTTAMLSLVPSDIGLSMMLLGAGLCWTGDALRQVAWPRALLRAAIAAALSLTLHWALTAGWLWMGQANPATRMWRDLATMGSIAVVAIAWARVRRTDDASPTCD